MREVYVFSTDPQSNRGGIANAVRGFLTCLELRGIHAVVFVTHDPRRGKLGNTIQFAKSTAHFLFRYVHSSLFRGNEKPVIYLHPGPKGSLLRKLLLAEIANALNLAVVTHHHSTAFYDYLSQRTVWSRALRRLSKLSRLNLVLSDWWLENYQRLGISNLAVVPNCVSLGAADVRTRSPGRSPRILSVGRLVAGKNFDLLIRAYSLLNASSLLSIAGDGPEAPTLRKLASELSPQHPVEFLGWIAGDKKADLYSRSDLFALPSDNDSFGMVFIEALSHGCPVVIGPNPAVISALSDLKGVFITEDYSPESVADAIRRALYTELNRKDISDACLERYGLANVSETLASTLFSSIKAPGP